MRGSRSEEGRGRGGEGGAEVDKGGRGGSPVEEEVF